jgi:hypothetical protein
MSASRRDRAPSPSLHLAKRDDGLARPQVVDLGAAGQDVLGGFTVAYMVVNVTIRGSSWLKSEYQTVAEGAAGRRTSFSDVP